MQTPFTFFRGAAAIMAADMSPNRHGSILSAFFEKTLKLTPLLDTVAPSGELFPRDL